MVTLKQTTIILNKLKKDIDINKFFNISASQYEITLLGWNNSTTKKEIEKHFKQEFIKDDTLIMNVKGYNEIDLRIVLTD